MIVAIPPGSVNQMWPLIGPGVERCIAKGIGTHTADEIREKAASGEWLLFTVSIDREIKCTIIASVSRGTRNVFEVGMAWGGDMVLWVDSIYNTLCTVAAELGCDSIAITGRRGWVRYLKNRGFTEKMVTVTKEI